MSDFPPAVLRALKKRSRGICEGCGLAQAEDAHHRQYRSRLGPSTLSNALHLCGRGNTSGCHKTAHDGKKGEARGWAIRSKFLPAEVPAQVVIDFVQQWVLFDDDGGHEVLNENDARELLALVNVGVA